MYLKASKRQIAEAAKNAAFEAMKDRTMEIVGHSGYIPQGSMIGQLMELISFAVEAGINSALNNIYTDEEFEQDLNLKP